MKPGIYRHYKGDLYDLQEIATLEANEEPVAVYRQLASGRLFVRPAKEFFEEIAHHGMRIARFEFVPHQAKRLIRAGAIIRSWKGDAYAIVNQHGNSWSLPKGGVDEGESLLEAMKREVKEETGLDHLFVHGYLGTYERCPMNAQNEDDVSAMNQIHLFAVSAEQVPLQPSDPHNPEARWVTAEEMLSMLTHRLDREAFQRFRHEFEKRFA